MKYYSIFLLLLVSCSDEPVLRTTHQPAPPAEWVNYNTANSLLPDNQVHAIAVDDEGNSWIGTANGLARFDGTVWQVFNESNSGLPSNFITTIAIGENQNIWIGTNKGLVRYDGEEWITYEETNRDYITVLYLDVHSHILWAGTERGLLQYSKTLWIRFDDLSSGLIDVNIHSLTVDTDGLLWVGAFDYFNFQGRLWTFDGVQWKASRIEQKGLPSTFPMALANGLNQSVLMGVGGTSTGGLVRITNENWEILDRSTTGFLGGVKCLAADAESIWMGGGSGLSYFNGASWKNYNSANSNLSVDFISSIAVDADQIWVGSIGGGITVIPRSEE
jgi:ligand-binding sensor domain-containing protein